MWKPYRITILVSDEPTRGNFRTEWVRFAALPDLARKWTLEAAQKEWPGARFVGIESIEETTV